jgi:murein DD-endopeptidase MepM/ murein hydrolase activator NlpD
VPSATNPTFSLSLPGPAPIGVPNFFIDSFRIPPFLLPIYQAAGIQYDVPWQVLAAINEIETDYGRNLSVSSAGAVGWMQFLPSTWKTWGVDANGDGVADPYNPVDAIFSAARYLHAANASQNLSGAIFAYNHATWYVQSVLLRAKLIGGIPNALIGALTGLVEGHFPVAAPAKYADDAVIRLARRRVTGSNAAIAVDSNPNATGTAIFAKRNSPVIAANDGKIVKIGTSRALGRYLELQDATGNIYTYAQLGSVVKSYPVPKPVKLTARDIAAELSVPSTSVAPSAPATAGSQQTPEVKAVPATNPTGGKTPAQGAGSTKRAPITLPSTSRSMSSGPSAAQNATAPMVKERLFADPSRAASYAAGGDLQLQSTTQQLASFQNYFSDVLHLRRNEYALKTLKVGSIVVAGTILGRIGASTPSLASHLYFMIQPAGKNAPKIDPKPVLDGWKLLEATAEYRAAGLDPFFGPGAKNPTVGQVLLMSKSQLTSRILQDPHVQIYRCGRRDIAAGLIDRRVLATIEFLSASGLDPSVSGLECGHSLTGSTGTDAAGATGASVDISKINNISVLGHQGPGSITDITIRRLLTLQGAMQPDQIISTIAYKGQSNTLALPDHQNRIQITFTPAFGTNKKLSGEIKSILQPGQWVQLINRISQIPEPIVPIAPSKYAIRTHGG